MIRIVGNVFPVVVGLWDSLVAVRVTYYDSVEVIDNEFDVMFFIHGFVVIFFFLFIRFHQKTRRPNVISLNPY